MCSGVVSLRSSNSAAASHGDNDVDAAPAQIESERDLVPRRAMSAINTGSGNALVSGLVKSFFTDEMSPTDE